MAVVKNRILGVQEVDAADLGPNTSPADPDLATVLDLPLQCNVVVAVIPSSVTSYSGPGTAQAGIKLPPDSDTEIGDELEVYIQAASAHGVLLIFLNSGTVLAGISIQPDRAAFIMRKIAANTWRILSGA